MVDGLALSGCIKGLVLDVCCGDLRARIVVPAAQDRRLRQSWPDVRLHTW